MNTKLKEPEWKTVPTFWARIYVAGDIATAENVCRDECFNDGLCVTIEPTHFIYTGGDEHGFVVGLINYPRFPSDSAKIMERAIKLAERLIVACCQWSALIMTPTETCWVNRCKDK